MSALNGTDKKMRYNEEVPPKERSTHPPQDEVAKEKTKGSQAVYYAILLFMFVTMFIGTLWIFSQVWEAVLKSPMCGL